MFAIILFHLVDHCISKQILTIQSDHVNFDQPIFYSILFIVQLVYTFGPIGNATFILISGYFTCCADKKINLIKTTKKLLAQLAFICIVLMISSQIVRQLVPDKYINTLSYGLFNNDFWYVGYYFIVIVIAELFLNKFLSKLDKRGYSVFLIVLFALFQFTWSGGVLNGTIGNGKTLGAGIFLYALGGYIRKYKPFDRIRTWVFFLVIVLMYALVWLSYYNTVSLSIDNYNKKGESFSQPLVGYSNEHIIIMILTVSIFELFKRMPEFKSKIINFFGASTFIIYMLHTNSFFFNLWKLKDWVDLLYNHKALYVATYLGYGLATFALGVIAYALYIGISKLCKKSSKLFVKPDS